MANLLGKSDLWKDIKQAEKDRRQDVPLDSFGVVRPADEERVQLFHDELLTSNDTKGLHDEAKSIWEATQAGDESAETWDRAEECMATLEKGLMAAQVAMYKAQPVVQGGRRKYIYSKQYALLARKYRMLTKLVTKWTRGVQGSRLMKLMQRTKQLLADEIPWFTVKKGRGSHLLKGRTPGF